jgi:hypothetical protein
LSSLHVTSYCNGAHTIPVFNILILKREFYNFRKLVRTKRGSGVLGKQKKKKEKEKERTYRIL